MTAPQPPDGGPFHDRQGDDGAGRPAPVERPAAATVAGLRPASQFGSGWADSAPSRPTEPSRPSTVLPDAKVRRPGPPRPTSTRTGERGVAGRPAGRAGGSRARKARLALKRIDPWSVFLFSLLASIFAGVALVVAVAVLYTILSGLGVVASINELVGEVSGDGVPLFTAGRFLGGAAVLAAINVVLLTLIATLGALLYNLCASFTGGIEVTLGERDR